MMRYNLSEKASLEKWLSEKAERRVELKSPQKGEKLRFVEMAEMNSKITLENKLKDKTDILFELKEVLGLENLPIKIECFDISNISGNYIVAGMCVAENGVIKKNLSRRFKIKSVFGQDDPRCMQEVVSRRVKHSIENPTGTMNQSLVWVNKYGSLEPGLKYRIVKEADGTEFYAEFVIR